MTRMPPLLTLQGCGLFLLLVALTSLSFSCSPHGDTKTQGDAPQVRVRLLAAVDRCDITANDAPTIITDSRRIRRKLGLPAGQPVSVTLNDRGWLINGVLAGDWASPLEIESTVPGGVLINGKPYRGSYRFVASNERGKFDVVNDVDVESYLLGVLAKELLPDWHIEAYKAQAIIARTYALYEVRTGTSGRHWDLHPDERSQVYGGMSAETPKSNQAVDQTRGVVCVWGPPGQEKIFKAYFSSCCGGISNSSADVFNEKAIPPLDARYNGGICSISTRYNWGPIVFTKAELTRRVRAWGVKQGRSEATLPGVANIEIATANQFGRPRRYLLTDTKGQQYSLTAEQMRWAINAEANGGPIVWSSFFRPVDAGDSIQFVEGHGFGHGVGACQWCMQAMALAGESFDTIVVKNFPQSQVTRAY